jgi:hypothetical protein
LGLEPVKVLLVDNPCAADARAFKKSVGKQLAYATLVQV